VTEYAAAVLSGVGDKMKLGILGGTFDPIHNGHILIAETVLSRLDLAEVLLIPAGNPRFKNGGAVTDACHRLKMVELAAAGKPLFRVSAMEVERRGITYTVDTLRELKDKLGAQSELFFVMGWGSLAEFPLWHKPSEIISLSKLVVVPRQGLPKPDLAELDRKIPGLAKQTIMLDEPLVELSSSDIRGRIKNGADIQGLVPDSVAAYIAENRLYQ